MTIYYSVREDDERAWARAEACKREREEELIAQGLMDLNVAKKRRGLRRRDSRMTRARVRELLAEVA